MFALFQRQAPFSPSLLPRLPTSLPDPMDSQLPQTIHMGKPFSAWPRTLTGCGWSDCEKRSLTSAWRPNTLAARSRFESRAFCAKFSADGNVFCAASQEGVIHLFEADTWRQFKEVHPFADLFCRLSNTQYSFRHFDVEHRSRPRTSAGPSSTWTTARTSALSSTRAGRRPSICATCTALTRCTRRWRWSPPACLACASRCVFSLSLRFWYS